MNKQPLVSLVVKYVIVIIATILVQHALRYLLHKYRAKTNRVVTDEQLMRGRVYW